MYLYGEKCYDAICTSTVCNFFTYIARERMKQADDKNTQLRLAK